MPEFGITGSSGAGASVEARPQSWLELKVDAGGRPVRGWGTGAGPYAWAPLAGLRWQRGSKTVGSLGVDRIEFDWRYGARVWDSVARVYEVKGKLADLAGVWLRLVTADTGAIVPLVADEQPDGEPLVYELVKAVVAEPLEQIEGDQIEDAGQQKRPSGRQNWVAYGAQWLLERVRLERSWWLPDPDDGEADVPFALDYLPAVNMRSGDPQRLGNRSSQKSKWDTYCFGGREQWTALDLLEYLLVMHVMIGSDGTPDTYNGPVFEIGGDRGQLLHEPRIDLPRMPARQRNVRRLLNELAPNGRGLDWCCDEQSDGWLIWIHALLSEDAAGDDWQVPANPYVSELNISDSDRFDCQLARSRTPRVERVRVQGDYARVCATFEGEGAGLDGTLVKGWSAALQAAYLSGAGGVDPTPQQHDAARSDDAYFEVFAKLVVPTDWDFAGGQANPRFEADGELVYEADHYQMLERSTEELLPLQQGGDYTSNPPGDRAVPGTELEYLPALALVYDALSEQYVPADKLSALRPELPSIQVIPLANQLGVLLRANPAHVLAAAEWAAGTPAETAVSWDPGTDGLRWDQVVATISFRTDFRVGLEAAVPAAERVEDGSVFVVDVPIAQFWLLRAQTVVGVDDEGVLLQSPGTNVILRDDRNLLRAMLPGALARYLRLRQRASITEFDVVAPYGMVLGTLLDLRGEQGELERIMTPVSTVSWAREGGDGPGGERFMTKLATGQATRGGRTR